MTWHFCGRVFGRHPQFFGHPKYLYIIADRNDLPIRARDLTRWAGINHPFFERPYGEIYIISEALLLWWQQMNWTHKTTPSGLKRYIQICISVHECPWFFRHEPSLLKALRNLYWQKPEAINGSQTARCINHKLGSAPVQVVSRSVWRVFVFFITLRSEHFGSCRRTGLKGAIRIVWGSCGVVESLMTKPHQQEIKSKTGDMYWYVMFVCSWFISMILHALVASKKGMRSKLIRPISAKKWLTN